MGCARHPAVHPLAHGLLDEQELGHDLGQRAARGDQAQHVVLVATLDRSEVERERPVQVVDHQPRHLLDLPARGQPRGKPGGDAKLRTQVGQLAGGSHAPHAGVGAVAAQRFGAAPALAVAGAMG